MIKVIRTFLSENLQTKIQEESIPQLVPAIILALKLPSLMMECYLQKGLLAENYPIYFYTEGLGLEPLCKAMKISTRIYLEISANTPDFIRAIVTLLQKSEPIYELNIALLPNGDIVGYNTKYNSDII